jgi:triosephosphate isomerase (TIM)
MFKTIPEALDYIRNLKNQLPFPLRAEVVLAPPFTALQALGKEMEKSPLQLAAQNVHWAEEGAFSGEISSRMLVDTGCAYCIIGHSERRHLFGETDSQVRKKLTACLKHGLRPILCVGETLEEREANKVEQVIGRQVGEAVQGMSAAEISQGVIAYEPVWAIGTGKSATPADAQEVHAFIRGLLETHFKKNIAMEKRIVYGGSVTLENIQVLYAKPDIDGALVGGASLNPEKFLALIQEVNQ